MILAASQDLSPDIYGAKPPLLLMFGCIAGIPAAIGAGLFTDALSGLPFGCSAVFCLIAALAVRFLRQFAFLTTVLSAALYQVWLAMWGGDAPVQSAYAALAYAVVLYPAACAALSSVKRHIGIEAVESEDAK
jgi:hypothetical protein